MRAVGRVVEIRRYPVKSLGGERLEQVAVDARGLVGDRRWAVHDGDGIGSAKTTRRFRRMEGLLELPARLDRPDRPPAVVLPDGRELQAGDRDLDAALSSRVGRPVALRAETSVSHFDEGPLHLVTSASLESAAARTTAEVTAARLRANLLVEVDEPTGFVEEGWVGRRLQLGGEVVVAVREPMPRCVTVELAQHGVSPAPGLLRTLPGVVGPSLGVVLDVTSPGDIRVGDEVTLLP